jgi:peptide deformylase
MIRVIKQITRGEHASDIFALVPKDSEVLTTVCPDFDFANPSTDPRVFAVNLAESMIHHYGIGLAAPQVGFNVRCFAMGSGNQVMVLFNPKILEIEGETNFDEGCLTFKGLFLRIKRPAKIKVEFYDFNGTRHEETYDGLTARTFLHELDHLNGIVFTTLVARYTLDRAKTHQKSNIKKLDAQRIRQEKERMIQQAIAKVQQQKKDEALQKSLTIDIPDIAINT